VKGRTVLAFRARTHGAALLIALLVACIVAAPASAANKPYSVVVSPGTVAGGAQVQFQAIFTNQSSPQHIGSANLMLPARFSAVSGSAVLSGPGTATLSGNVMQLRNLDIAPGGTLTATVRANVPCATGRFAWTVIAKQANDFSGPPGNDFGPLAGPPSNLITSVTGACAAALRFATQPANAHANQAITTTPLNSPPGGPVTVEVIDGTGNRLTTPSAVITMSLVPDTAALNGTKVVTAVNGLATFADLSIDAPGSYKLLASSEGLTSVTSSTFQVVANDAQTVCVEDVNCTATLSNADAQFDITAQGNAQFDAGVLTLNRMTGLDCAGYNELVQGDFAVDFLPNPGFIGRQKLATLTISKEAMQALPENGAAQVNMCFGAPFRFAVKPGTPPLQEPQPGFFVGLLPDCGTPPCVSKRNKTQAGQGVIQARAPGGDKDPRFGG
jgi:hypothetical protein